MIEISYKRYGELVGSAVRVSELEQELARMTKNFEMQTENVQYWKSAAEAARVNVDNLAKSVRQQEKKIVELESALDEAINRLAAIVVVALGAE